MLHLQSYNGRFVSSHLFSFRGRFLQSFSISTTTERSPKSIESFMVNSLGLSNQQSAISTPRKVRKSNLKRNPNSVIDFFKQNGFDDTQITNIVSKKPYVLTYDVEKTLKPKFRVFQGLGLSGSDLGDFVAACGFAVFHTLSGDWIDFLIPIFGTNENVVKALKKSYYALSADIATRNFTLLQNHGVDGVRLQKAIVQHQEILTCKPERLEKICARIETEFGVSPKSHAFIPMIRVFIVNKAETLEQKYQLFKSYGWTESDMRWKLL